MARRFHHRQSSASVSPLRFPISDFQFPICDAPFRPSALRLWKTRSHEKTAPFLRRFAPFSAHQSPTSLSRKHLQNAPPRLVQFPQRICAPVGVTWDTLSQIKLNEAKLNQIKVKKISSHRSLLKPVTHGLAPFFTIAALQMARVSIKVSPGKLNARLTCGTVLRQPQPDASQDSNGI